MARILRQQTRTRIYAIIILTLDVKAHDFVVVYH